MSGRGVPLGVQILDTCRHYLGSLASRCGRGVDGAELVLGARLPCVRGEMAEAFPGDPALPPGVCDRAEFPTPAEARFTAAKAQEHLTPDQRAIRNGDCPRCGGELVYDRQAHRLGCRCGVEIQEGRVVG